MQERARIRLLATFDTDGEVIVFGGLAGRQSELQAHAPPKSCLSPTSPSVSLLVMWFGGAIQVYQVYSDVYV
jgi:hypothetical protein